MPYKNKADRKKNYDLNKDEINRKRREHNKLPEVSERIRKQDKDWRNKNKEKVSKSNKIYGKKYKNNIRELVFEHYGKKCVCCGEDILEFLTIDHIDGGGTNHRKIIHQQTYIWLVKNNFPKGFQTLCFNCNWGKYKNNGICPHKINN